MKDIISFNQDYLLYALNSFLFIEKRFKEFNFLQKKRTPEYCQLKLDNNIIYKKEINFSIINELINSKNDLYSYPIIY